MNYNICDPMIIIAYYLIIFLGVMLLLFTVRLSLYIWFLYCPTRIGDRTTPQEEEEDNTEFDTLLA